MQPLVRATVAMLGGLALAACGGGDDVVDAPQGAIGEADDTAADGDSSSGAGTEDPVEGVDPDTRSQLDSALADVGSAAPRLESFLRGTEYPTDVAGAVAAMAEAGIELSDGNVVGSYLYDPDAVEFTLCVETPLTAWATYDTAPMSVGDQGEDGGCPDQ